MVNTRAKAKRITNTLQLRRFSESDNHQPIVSASLVASNDQLITQILLGLPVTSILRFKSVSKHWNSLLTYPRFTLLYDRIPPTPGLFLGHLYIPFEQKPTTPPPFRSIDDFYLDPYGIKIVQSCNGLLLCCSNRGHIRARKYYVFNPTTKQFAVVPSVPGGTNVRKNICFMGLAFDGPPHYNLLCVHRRHQDNNLFRIQIYSSETGKWKIVSTQTFSSDASYFRGGVYWNKAILWAPSCINPTYYFKLDVQELVKMPLPDQPVTSSFYQHGAFPRYFGECGGHLHLCMDGETPLHLNVYEMMSDYSGWFIKYQVELDELLIAYPEMNNRYLYPSSRFYYTFKVLDVVRRTAKEEEEEEEEEEAFMVVCIPGKIIRFDLMNKSFNQIFDLNLNNVYYGSIGTCHLEVHRYIQAISSFYNNKR